MRTPRNAPPNRVDSIGALVRLDEVTYSYAGGGPVLDDVSLTIRPGSFTGIVGPSGSGKTTVLRLLLGVKIASGHLAELT